MLPLTFFVLHQSYPIWVRQPPPHTFPPLQFQRHVSAAFAGMHKGSPFPPVCHVKIHLLFKLQLRMNMWIHLACSLIISATIYISVEGKKTHSSARTACFNKNISKCTWKQIDSWFYGEYNGSVYLQGFHGLCLQQERAMEQDSYHNERSHCLSDMRRQCVGVLGLEAREAQGPVNTTSPSLICATLEDLCCYKTSPNGAQKSRWCSKDLN